MFSGGEDDGHQLEACVAAYRHGDCHVLARLLHPQLQGRRLVQYPLWRLVELLTTLGCFTISIVSFILPPLLHMRILPNYSKGSWYLDLLFVILGVGVMALATFTTVLTIFHSLPC